LPTIEVYKEWDEENNRGTGVSSFCRTGAVKRQVIKGIYRKK
jgi:hypothetical protein